MYSISCKRQNNIDITISWCGKCLECPMFPLLLL